MRTTKKFLPIILLIAVACNLPARTQPSTVASTIGETELAPSPSETSAPAPSPTPADVSSPAGNPYELLIVTPRAFLAPMRKLADWKTSTGMQTGILVLDEAYRLCDGRDTPEKIKRCLALYQKESGIRYAMLVGDGDQFPIRWTQADIVGPTVGNTAFYPADLYYADLYKADGSFDDWDYNKNGYYGELGGEIRSGLLNIDRVDLNPDIAVGRAPVSTLEEAFRYAEKVILYESGAYQSDWAQRVLAISSGGYLPDDCKRQEEMLKSLPGQYTVTRLYYTDNPCQKTAELTADNVIGAINNGVGMVSYLGHGSLDFWFDAVSVKDFTRLDNVQRLPVTFSGGCGTATFTAYPPGGPYEDINGIHHAGGEAGETFSNMPPQPAPLQVQENNDGMMEFTLVQMPGGAVIYVGAVTGSQFPMMFDVNKYFFEGVVQSGPRVGDAWNFAIRKYYAMHLFKESYDHADWIVIADFHQVWKFMLFGDPSLRIGGVASP
jgi:hypothetical protein